MTEVTFNIEGMSCQHCVMRVQKAINSVEGVSSSDVSVGSAKTIYDETLTNLESIKKAVEKAGYKIID